MTEKKISQIFQDNLKNLFCPFVKSNELVINSRLEQTSGLVDAVTDTTFFAPYIILKLKIE